jgi:hypothetical protein
MEKFTWFHEPKVPINAPVTDKGTKTKLTYVYWSDNRLPASLVGLGATPTGIATIPMGQLVGVWSEPPYATIGLGTGTMACYGRPYQHMHFYEIDSHIRKLSLPFARGEEHPLVYWKMAEFNDKLKKAGQPRYFTNLAEAIERGVELHVLMGDARLRMAQPWTSSTDADHWEKTGGPDHFYSAIIVDAFSSDAIPIHLITKEAFELYFQKLNETGILCMHTSNKYVDLVRVCGDLANELGYAWKRGHTAGGPAPGEKEEVAGVPKQPGHFSSEWVMIARKAEYLGPQGPHVRYGGWAGLVEPNATEYWSDQPYWNYGSNVWTDDNSNMWAVFRPFLSR